MALGLYRHLRSPLNPNPEGMMLSLMEKREENFLAMTQRLMADAGHPYAQLFRIAGCGYSDIEDSVRRRGLEPTLEFLLQAGVYLTHDEFRGRKEIIRDGKRVPANLASWDNKKSKGLIQNISSGSSGDMLATQQSVAYHGYLESGILLFMREFDLANRAIAYIAPILPAGYGIAICLLTSRLQMPVERWFAIGGSLRGNAHYRTLTRCLVAQLLFFGAKVPYPTYLDQNDFSPLARFLAQRKSEGARPVIGGLVSAVSRAAADATELGLDIAGSLALVSGEALTDSKRRIIEAAGMEVFPTYGASEVGNIGFPCRQMSTGNCVHVFRGSIALVSRSPRPDSAEAAPLHATTLLPFAPRSLINVQIGDTGVIERTSCDCVFSRLGFNLQVRNIAGIAKVNGLGMTLPASDIVRVLEEVMPQRFGGFAGDYQLLEIEGKHQTDMVLRIHPRVGLRSPDEALRFFLDELRDMFGGSLTIMSWIHSNAVRAEIAEPALAHTGKFRAIRLLGSGIDERPRHGGSA